MKSEITEIKFSVEIIDGRIVGGYNEHMGHGTGLVVGGHPDIDDGCGNLSADVPKQGDHIMFEIPSGDFEGKVGLVYPDKVRKGYYTIWARGSWIGKYYGLTGGRSCYGNFTFEINDFAIIESSWGAMEYREYLLIRCLRDNSEIAEHAIQKYREIIQLEEVLVNDNRR